MTSNSVSIPNSSICDFLSTILPQDKIQEWEKETIDALDTLTPTDHSQNNNEDMPVGCCQRFKARVKRAETFFSACGDGFALLESSVKAKLFDDILRLLKNLSSNTESSGQHAELLQNTIKVLKLAPVLSIPFALYTIITQGYKCATGNEKVDAGLRTLEGCAWLSDSVSGFIKGLISETGNNIGQNAAIAAYGLSIAGSVLWMATAVLNVKRICQNNKALNHIDNTIQFDKEKPNKLISAQDYSAAIKVFSNEPSPGSANGYSDYNLKEHFNVEGKELRKNLTKIGAIVDQNLLKAAALETLADKFSKLISRDLELDNKERSSSTEALISFTQECRSGASKLKEEAHDVSKTTVENLKGRIKSNNFSRKLTILSAVVYFVGMSILLFTALTPVGYAILAISAAISISRTIYEYRATKQFKKKLEELSVPTKLPLPGFNPNRLMSGLPPPQAVMI